MKRCKISSRRRGSAGHLHLSVWCIFRWGWHRIDWAKSNRVDSSAM